MITPEIVGNRLFMFILLPLHHFHILWFLSNHYQSLHTKSNRSYISTITIRDTRHIRDGMITDNPFIPFILPLIKLVLDQSIHSTNQSINPIVQSIQSLNRMHRSNASMNGDYFELFDDTFIVTFMACNYPHISTYHIG